MNASATWQALRRWLWAGALLFATVALVAGLRALRDARQPAYLSTQTLVVSSLPPAGGGAYAADAAAKAAQRLSIAFGAPSTLAAPDFAARVATQARSDWSLALARFGLAGARAAYQVGASTIPGALTLRHDDLMLILTAHATSPERAWVLATAAGQVLTSAAVASPLTTGPATEGITLRVVASGPASAPTRDPAPAAAAGQRFLQTLLIGLLAGLLLPLLLAAWQTSRGAVASSPTHAPAATERE